MDLEAYLAKEVCFREYPEDFDERTPEGSRLDILAVIDGREDIHDGNGETLRVFFDHTDGRDNEKIYIPPEDVDVMAATKRELESFLETNFGRIRNLASELERSLKKTPLPAPSVKPG